MLRSEPEIERSREYTKSKREMEMIERNLNCKRDLEEASSTSVSPLKKTKLDDSSSDSHDVVFTVSSGYSVTSGGEENDQRSSVISGCCSSESKEITNNSRTPVVDLEAHQISETETSTFIFITSNFRKETSPVREGLGETTTEMKDDREKTPEVSKTPTPAEIEDFLSELEKDDDRQKQFIEKYNFDIVNDEPLQGRYKWVRVEPESK